MSRVSVFWVRWLIATSLFVAAFGLSMVVAPQLPESYFNLILFGEFAEHTRFSAEAHTYIRFAYAVMGSLMAGWVASLLALIVGPLRRGERSAWIAIAVSVAVWFVLDSAASIALGFWQNAVSNLGFAILVEIPLLATYRTFFPASTPVKSSQRA